ncbi:alpha/beta hydrolase [Vibrio coralliilyticus]|uniref:alpha/beta hydrolase n=1 Tax=Vibrio coralliilyticus TaxID=190893 RepID=UPI000697DEE1|nr:alpha/beta hydrolase [Vibrio coralliilyticus]QOU31112.1 alpha/beta hydrolase [Vibrio coralliilyticus]
MPNYDHEFNLRQRHPFGRWHLLKNEWQSTLARQHLTCSLDIEYGPTPGQKLDVFPAKTPGAPVLFFIHGGYFRALDKRQYSYLAKPFVNAGCTVVLINYDLAPSVSVTQIIDQNVAAFDWVKSHIHNWNGNADNIVICGHSVGAFLASKIAEHRHICSKEHSLSGLALLSGVYDLTKVKDSYLNDSLNLTMEEIEASPIFSPVAGFPPTLVAVGGNETKEFIRQSEHYFAKLEAVKVESEFHNLDTHNHYTVSRLLASRDNVIFKKILALFAI